MSERKSGLLLHISSLPSGFGIGDLGPGAYRFADFLQRSRQTYWQILPINPTDHISAHSPYSSLSAFAANILFISPQLLIDEGLLDDSDIANKPDFPLGSVDYNTVMDYKQSILDRAYESI